MAGGPGSGVAPGLDLRATRPSCGQHRLRPCRLPLLCNMSRSAILTTTKVVLAVFWGSAIFYVFLGHLPESPHPRTQQERINLIAISPQGWSFFTRSPREPVVHVYEPNPTGWHETDRANFHLSNWLGVRRIPRIKQVELKAMLAEVDDEAWTKCAGSLELCLDQNEVHPVTVSNPSTTKNLCGEYLLQRKEPVPWAWSHAASEVTMPSSVVRLTATCSQTAVSALREARTDRE